MIRLFAALLAFVSLSLTFEVPAADIEKITSEAIRQEIVKNIKALGFQYISLDLQGFRSGSLNETLSEDEKVI